MGSGTESGAKVRAATRKEAGLTDDLDGALNQLFEVAEAVLSGVNRVHDNLFGEYQYAPEADREGLDSKGRMTELREKVLTMTYTLNRAVEVVQSLERNG